VNTRFVERDYDAAAARRLAAEGILAPLARALAARGVGSVRDLLLETRDIHAPGDLAHIDVAARLLADAIEAGRRMTIVADYDCDGATACAVGVRGLRALGASVDYVVPNRFEFGYGLTAEIVDLAAARSPRPELLITVDNGIASVEGVERAAQLGMAVLITDHHLPGERLPAAAAIVNPNQRGCGFPSKNLAGVGVMFYVLIALRAELRQRGRFTEATQPRLDTLLDLVALGTVADVVRLDRNNRILVSAGLHRVRTGRMQPGVAALFQIAGRSTRTAQAGDFGFAVGPRINAAGRLTDMTIGIECLLTDDPERALELAGRLEALNRERRAIESDMNFEAMAELEGERNDDQRTICLFNASWHPGVVGLVASRVKERFHRPTIAFAGLDGAELKGSGRSIEGVHLRDTLDLVTKVAPHLVEKFGGHAMAAGLTLKRAHFETFVEAFEAATRASSDAQLFARTLATDGPLAPKDITYGLVESIERQIWGQGFPPPVFENEFTVLEQRLLNDQHLKLALELGGKRFDAIWFRRTMTVPSRLRLAYRPIADEYQGMRRINLLIEAASL
jgi:single-stranded-DNA-specific exonuclease